MLARHAASAAAAQFQDPSPVPAVTDWNWFMEFMKRGGKDSERRYQNWIGRRRRFAPAWQASLEEFKAFRHEHLYRLVPSDFEHAVHGKGFEHSLGDLEKDKVDHRLSRDYSPPIPFMFPFYLQLEKLKALPSWTQTWKFLTKERPDLVLHPYALYNGIPADDPALIQRGRYSDALQWRIGLIFYSWYREVHLLTVLRCTYGLDVRYHFLVDAEWKADLVGGDALLELYIKNGQFKGADGEGRKETCASANRWTRPIVMGIDSRRVRGRPWFIGAAEIKDIAERMLEKGCPRLMPA